MAASAISNLLRKNVGAGLARVSLNKNIIRNYFSLVFSVDKRAFKRRVWFDFKEISVGKNVGKFMRISNSDTPISCGRDPLEWLEMLNCVVNCVSSPLWLWAIYVNVCLSDHMSVATVSQTCMH